MRDNTMEQDQINDYMLTLSCVSCGHQFEVRELKDAEKYVERVRNYIKTLSPENPDHRTIRLGRRVDLGLVGIRPPSHLCRTKILNLSLCLENKNYFSQEKIKSCDFFSLNGHPKSARY